MRRLLCMVVQAQQEGRRQADSSFYDEDKDFAKVIRLRMSEKKTLSNSSGLTAVSAS